MLRALSAALAAILTGCAAAPPMPPVRHVDLDRFMGDWYVIAHIPSWPERHAYDAVESYRRLPDGRIQTDFRYRKGSFEADVSTDAPRGHRPAGYRQRGVGHAVHLADPGGIRAVSYTHLTLPTILLV